MDVSVNLTRLIFSANFVKNSTDFHKIFQLASYNQNTAITNKKANDNVNLEDSIK